MPWCNYIFGNLPDMKRHLRQRHNMKDAEITQLLSQSSDGNTGSTSSVVAGSVAPTDVIAPLPQQTLASVGIAQEVTVENADGQEQRVQVGSWKYA